MTPMFVSAFAGPLRAFVDQKRALGHPYAGSIDILRQFDAMCSLELPGRTDLAQDICMADRVLLRLPRQRLHQGLARQDLPHRPRPSRHHALRETPTPALRPAA